MPETATPGVLSNDVTSSVIIAQPKTSDDPANKAATSGDATATNDDNVPEDQLPQRLRGTKSFKDAVSKYRELESELGRKNNEVGQLRFVVDEMLQLKRASDLGSEPAKKHTPVNTDALLADPESAISSVVERTASKATSAVTDRLDRMEFEVQREKFSAKFPKFEETMASPEFVEWIKQSPYRMRLAQATTQGSFEAAHELFGLHSEVEAIKASAVKQDPKLAAAGTLSRPGNGNTTGGAAKKQAPSAARAGQEIYSRAELAKLYMNDRDAYNAMGKQIRAAYADGRVK